MKNYKCEIPGCNTTCKIRSTIRNPNSEYNGLKVCNLHASQYRVKKTSDKTRQTLKNRKEQRKDYGEFYSRYVQIANKSRCEECGCKLQGSSTEVAHILSKSVSPEVATDDDNIVLLCSEHHAMFDSSLSKRSTMKCFNKSVEQYIKLKNKLTNITGETLFYNKYIENERIIRK